ncbi:unnamed protein product [Prunus brigantina]
MSSSSASKAIVAASVGVVEALKDQGICRWNSALRSVHQQAKTQLRSFSQANKLSSSSASAAFSKVRDEKLKKSEESLRTVMYLSCWGFERSRLLQMELHHHAKNNMRSFLQTKELSSSSSAMILNKMNSEEKNQSSSVFSKKSHVLELLGSLLTQIGAHGEVPQDLKIFETELKLYTLFECKFSQSTKKSIFFEMLLVLFVSQSINQMGLSQNKKQRTNQLKFISSGQQEHTRLSHPIDHSEEFKRFKREIVERRKEIIIMMSSTSVGVVEALKDQGICRWKSALRSVHQQARTQLRSFSLLSSSSASAAFSTARDEKLKKSEESLRTVMYLSCWGPN